MYLLALAVLRQPLEIAARTMMGASTGRWSASTISNALVFVHGSALNMVFEEFALDADPDQFRSTFFSWCRTGSHHQVLTHTYHTWHVGRPHSAS